MRITKRITLAGKGAAGIALALGLALSPASVFLPTTAHAEEILTFSPFFPDSGGGPTVIHGIARALAPRWKAWYGIAPADRTALTSSLLRFDQTLAFGTRSDGASRNDWRHFFGLEYAPIKDLAFSGGIAGTNGKKGNGLSPSYESVRLSADALWKSDNWDLDGSFAFVPTGSSHVPSDAAFFPGLGGSGPTYLFALTISRHF